MPLRAFHRDTARPGARECQVCAREVMARNGLIAHHGFERPGDGEGIRHTCWGSRQRAYADSNDALPGAIASIGNMIAERLHYRDNVKHGAVALPSVFAWNPLYGTSDMLDDKYKMIEPHERDEMNFNYRDYPTRQAQVLREVDRRIAELERTREEFQKRLDAWFPGIGEAVLPGMPI